MSWRTVIITKRAKLDLKTGYLVVRTEEDILRIVLDEISVLIIENPAVAIMVCLVAALNEKKIKVIFCDEKRSPCCELISFNGTLICIESHETVLLENEHRVIIDQDLCIK